MRETEEMAVEPGKAAHADAARGLGAELKPGLVAVFQVMMPYIGRIADDEVESWRGFGVGVVGELERESGVAPESGRGAAMGIGRRSIGWTTKVVAKW
jgi:hypothetical protein